jgi:hypothetical protein
MPSLLPNRAPDWATARIAMWGVADHVRRHIATSLIRCKARFDVCICSLPIFLALQSFLLQVHLAF